MSLRRSPRRTPAFLAANRANAQKSTGPRTALGKQRSAANAFRTGSRTSPALCIRGLSQREVAEFYALRDAIDRALSAGSEGQKFVGLVTRLVWSVRRSAERQLRTMRPETRRLIAKRLIPVPHFWHRVLRRPGWKVTATVFARRGRRRRSEMSWIPPVGAIRMPEAKPARVHVITRVTCTGHPLFNRGPEGVPLSLKPGAKSVGKPAEIRTNPESITKQDIYRNIAPNADSPKPDSPRVPSRSRRSRSFHSFSGCGRGRASVGVARGISMAGDGTKGLAAAALGACPVRERRLKNWIARCRRSQGAATGSVRLAIT